MLFNILKELDDPRRPEGRMYKLHEVLTISILSILGGAKTYTDIHTFIKNHFEKLKNIFNLNWKKPIHKDSIRYIFIQIDPENLDNILKKHSEILIKNMENKNQKHFAFDGKSLRGSFDHLKDQRAKNIMHVIENQSKILLCHYIEEKKEDCEMHLLQKFLEELNLENVVVTADALHCQKNTLKIAKKKT